MRPVIYMAPMMAGLMALAACGQNSSAPAASPEAPAASEVAGVKLDQSLMALGNEPFWSVDIEPAGLTYKPMDGETFTVSHTGPEVTGNVAVWSGTTADGKKLAVTVTGTDCSDTMSDRTYPLTARVEVGDKIHVGCAASKEALQRVGESGRVE